MKIRKYLGPNRLFLWHSIQAIACLILAITGLGMYFSDLGEYIMDFEAQHELHQFTGIAATAAYLLLFIPYHLEANHQRVHYWWRLILHRLGLFENLHHLSKLQFKSIVMTKYIIVMFMIFPLLICTGGFMIFPEMLMNSTIGIDLYLAVLFLHIACATILILFTIIHLYVALVDKKKAGWLNGFFKIWFSS